MKSSDEKAGRRIKTQGRETENDQESFPAPVFCFTPDFLEQRKTVQVPYPISVVRIY